MFMKVLTIALLCTALFASSTSIRFQNTKAVLAEIDQDKFGATMISAIQMNMANSSPVEEIVLLIEEIVSQLETDESSAADENQSFQAECETSIETLTDSIADTKATISSTEKAIELNEDILQTAQESLAQADIDYQETLDSISSGTQEREEQHSRWIEEDYDQQIQIATLEEGVKLINHMIHGVAFSQIKSRYDKVLDTLSNNNSKHAPLFKPLISSLTQLATKLNYENVMKILELLNNIRTSIVEERQNARLQEEKAQADWEKLLAHLMSEKVRLADKRARLRSLIDATTTLLAQLRESLENNRVFLEDFEATLVAKTAECTAAAQKYATESEERVRELDILNKLLEHIREKAAAVQEYVAGRQGGLDFL